LTAEQKPRDVDVDLKPLSEEPQYRLIYCSCIAMSFPRKKLLSLVKKMKEKEGS